MRLIHCADLHLDAKMNAILTREQAQLRKNELLAAFRRMTEYAKENRIRGILISGDLFDSRRISRQAAAFVYETICQSPEITFFYLPGNHEKEGFTEKIPEIPSNLKLFGEGWTVYEFGGVRIAGIVLTDTNSRTIYDSLKLDPDGVNLVMLHGQISQYGNKDKAEVIDLSRLRDRRIDYLALGHVHEYQEGILAPNGVWCYPGCLEGRGFDECGTHGFVVLDIEPETRRILRYFVPFASRTLYEIEVDVTGCENTLQMEERIRNAMTEPEEKDMVKVILTGELDVTVEKNLPSILQLLEPGYFRLKLEDRTRLGVDYRSFLLDASLKGEFVRLVQAEDSLSEELKAEIIRCGIQALAGEEPEI